MESVRRRRYSIPDTDLGRVVAKADFLVRSFIQRAAVPVAQITSPTVWRRRGGCNFIAPSGCDD